MIKLFDPFSTTILKSGTIIEKAIAVNRVYKNKNFFGTICIPSEKDGITKLITYSPESQMGQLGINQVAISKFPDGMSYYNYYYKDKLIQSLGVNKNGNVIAAHEQNGSKWIFGGSERVPKEYLKSMFKNLKDKMNAKNT